MTQKVFTVKNWSLLAALAVLVIALDNINAQGEYSFQ